MSALVRTREQAARLEERGVEPVVGNLADPDTYRKASAGFDGYVHAAFENSDRGTEIDRIAIGTLAEAASAPAVLIYTSGVWVLGQQRTPADETVAPKPAPNLAWRLDHERLVLGSATKRLRAIVVRPGIVYGGWRGLVADLFKDASNGLMRVIGSGENHWPLVYHRDLGELYVRLMTDASASGLYHVNDEGDERVIDVVEAIAGAMTVRPEFRFMPIEEARAKMGSYADALALDQRMRSPRARALGWTPGLRSVAGSVGRLLEEWRRGRDAA